MGSKSLINLPGYPRHGPAMSTG